MWGNIQRQIQREKVSSWIPLGLFMREMKSLYNTGMILTFWRRDNFWKAALSRELDLNIHLKSRWLRIFRYCTWKHQKKKPLGSLLSTLSKWMDAVVYTINRAWPLLLKPDLFPSDGAQHLIRPPTTATTLLHRRHWFQSIAKALIFKVKSDHRQQILMHSAPETSHIMRS